MKKIIALFLMAMLLFSIVPVFAHEETRAEHEGECIVVPESVENITEYNERCVHDLEEDSETNEENSRGNRGRSDERIDDSAEINDDSDTVSLEDSNLEKRGRLDVNTLKKESRQKFLEAKSRLMTAKEVYMNEKASLKLKRDEVKNFCKENPDSERCNEKKRAFMEKDAKKYLLQVIDVIENALEKRKTKIENILAEEKVTSEAKTELEAKLEQINLNLEKLAELRTRVEAATTKEEIKALATEIKLEWKDIKANLEVSRGTILANKFSFVVHRSEALEDKLDRTLKNLESKGYDVNVVEEDLTNFNGHIAKAKDLVTQAKLKFVDKNEVNVKDGHKLLTEAHQELKLAHQELKKILAGIKLTAGAEAQTELNVISESRSDNEDSNDNINQEDSNTEGETSDSESSNTRNSA